MRQNLEMPGEEDFGRLIESGTYYVDKTKFLRALLTRTGNVSLFTRPRRFGKTLTMTMLRDFLQVDFQNPGSTQVQQNLFAGLDVMKDHELCEKFMGQFPVIFLTLKDAAGDTFQEALDKIAATIADVAGHVEFLLDSPRLNERSRKSLNRLLDMENGVGRERLALENAIPTLATLLYLHFGRKVFVLVDEYDVPLAYAQQNGYHKSMVSFYKGFMGFLKLRNWRTLEIPLATTVMTGCLRVAKNQIFTGANNFSANTILSLDNDFSSLFGFTPCEVEAFLSSFGLAEYKALVKKHYDGYRFGEDEIYNPWDVGKFIAEARKLDDQGNRGQIRAENYWTGSESTNTTAIKEYVGTLRGKDTQNLQDLSDGNEVEVVINDSMDYDCLNKHNVTDMWSLLLHTGYLTAAEVISSDKCMVKIPNAEIKKCFDDSIMASFKDAVRSGGRSLDLGLAILGEDRSKAEKIIKKTLGSYVEARFSATSSRPENFYEGYMLGTLSCSDSVTSLKLETQAGKGFADIMFSNADGDCMVIVELKTAKYSKSVRDTAGKAIEQILDREYARQYVENDTVDKVLAVGIAFFDRSACVEFKILKGRGAKRAEN